MLSTRKEKQNVKSIKEWDPDFTKTTPKERKAIDQAEQDFTKGTTVSHDQIDWN